MPAELATTLTTTETTRLEQAEALVRSYCGWHIAPSRTETVTVDAVSSAVLVLPTLHLTAVTTVIVDGTAWTTDDYRWSTAGVLTLVHSSYWWGGRVQVTFTHGHPTPPPEVTAVVQAIAARAQANPNSLIRQQVGPFSDTYSQTATNQTVPLTLLDAEKQALGHYKLPPRP